MASYSAVMSREESTRISHKPSCVNRLVEIVGFVISYFALKCRRQNNNQPPQHDHIVQETTRCTQQEHGDCLLINPGSSFTTLPTISTTFDSGLNYNADVSFVVVPNPVVPGIVPYSETILIQDNGEEQEASTSNEISVKVEVIKRNGCSRKDLEKSGAYISDYQGIIDIKDISGQDKYGSYFVEKHITGDWYHCTAMVQNGDEKIYFDSMGNPPPNKNQFNKIYDIQVQHYMNNTCAFHCIFVLIELTKGKTMEDIMKEYQTGNEDNMKNNDDKVVKYYDKLIKNP